MIEMAFLKMARTGALMALRYVASETAACADAGPRKASLISEIAGLRELAAPPSETTDVRSPRLDECAGDVTSSPLSAQPCESISLTGEIGATTCSQLESHAPLASQEPRQSWAVPVLAKLGCTIARHRTTILTSLYQRGARNIAEQWHRLDDAPSNDEPTRSDEFF